MAKTKGNGSALSGQTELGPQRGGWVLALLYSCAATLRQQGSQGMLKGRETVHCKIWPHGNNNITCLWKLILMQPEGFVEEPFNAVAPDSAASFALHTDAQTAALPRTWRDNQAETLAMPSSAMLIHLLEFTVQVQAHGAGEGAAAGHGITAPAACGLWPFFF